MNKMLSLILKIVLFVIGISLIIVNQKTIGWTNVALMVLGLGILLGLMHEYNKKFK